MKRRWVIILEDGREVSGVDPKHVPLDSPVEIIVHLDENDEPILLSGNYTHFTYRTDINRWIGHERDSDACRAFMYHAEHISSMRSSITMDPKRFGELWRKARALAGMKE